MKCVIKDGYIDFFMYMYPIQNGQRQGDVLTLPLNFAVNYAIRKV